MTTYLEIINQARRHFAQGPIPVASATSNSNPELIVWMACIQEAAREIITSSPDWQWNEVFDIYAVTSGNSLLEQDALDEEWDEDDIHSIVLLDSAGKDDGEVFPVGSEKGKSLLTILPPGAPLFYFLNDRKINVVPVPDATYNLRVYYPNALPTIDANNVNSEIPMSVFVEHALLFGTRIYRRRDLQDSSWKEEEPAFNDKIARAIDHNKSSAKEKGAMQFFYVAPVHDRNYG